MIATLNMRSQNHHHQQQQQSTSNHNWQCPGCDFGPCESHEQYKGMHEVFVMDAMTEFPTGLLEWAFNDMNYRDFGPCESHEQYKGKHVVLVIFAMKEFPMRPLEWALNNMDPFWKNETDIWTMNKKYLQNMRETGEWKNDISCQKAQDPVQKHIEYVAKKVPCNILVMSNNDEVPMIKGLRIDGESQITFSTSTIPAPTLILSEEYKRKLEITIHTCVIV